MTARRPKTLRRRLHSIMFKAPLMITCEEFEDFILAYLDNELSNRQRFVFEMHLKVCAECRAYLAEYRRAVYLTEDQAKDLSDDVPDDLVAAILEARNAK